jgi:hypothetical protein
MNAMRMLSLRRRSSAEARSNACLVRAENRTHTLAAKGFDMTTIARAPSPSIRNTVPAAAPQAPAARTPAAEAQGTGIPYGLVVAGVAGAAAATWGAVSHPAVLATVAKETARVGLIAAAGAIAVGSVAVGLMEAGMNGGSTASGIGVGLAIAGAVAYGAAKI